LGNTLNFLSGSRCFSSDNYIHIDFAGLWISGCLFDGNFHEVNSLLDVTLFNIRRKFHFSESLTQSDEGLKLSGGGCDGFGTGS
jgi:hypothetical protein